MDVPPAARATAFGNLVGNIHRRQLRHDGAAILVCQVVDVLDSLHWFDGLVFLPKQDGFFLEFGQARGLHEPHA